MYLEATMLKLILHQFQEAPAIFQLAIVANLHLHTFEKMKLSNKQKNH